VNKGVTRAGAWHACLALATAVGLVAMGVAACDVRSPSGASTAGAAASVPAGGSGSRGSAPATAGGSAGATTSMVTAQKAVSLHGALVVRKAPSVAAASAVRLPATTPLGSPRVLLVDQVIPGWVRVALPTRPNGGSGWLAASAVRIETVRDLITVDLSARRMTAFLDGRQVASGPVGVGSTTNPTPTGRFFVTDRVQPADPHGPYGGFALGLSAHSTTLSEFGSGDGQVGIHGTNSPGSVGQAVSHGCIRVPADATAVLARVSLGTPVIIR
jgi:lipoprotein-anchoring transpeptidase ErfK/SrfK